MNPLQQIEKAILNRFPDAKTAIDQAETEDGSWFLDVTLGDYSLVAEWSPLHGVGITSNPEIGYGEGAEEVFQSVSEAQERMLELLLSKTKTVPPIVTLSKIRKERNLTQAQLASALNIRQASVAKLEKRSDILLSTLQMIISAMGGRLLIRAVFPDGAEREICFNQTTESDRVESTS